MIIFLKKDIQKKPKYKFVHNILNYIINKELSYNK